MPAKSKSQQRLMGMAYAVAKFLNGDGTGLDPDELDPNYKDEILKLANSIDMKSLKDFAKTPHKKLPEIKENTILSFEQYIAKIQ